MATLQHIHIGILSPATADRPHFKSLEQMLPAEVTVTNEGLGLLRILIMTSKERPTRSPPVPPTSCVETKSTGSSLPADS